MKITSSHPESQPPSRPNHEMDSFNGGGGGGGGLPQLQTTTQSTTTTSSSSSSSSSSPPTNNNNNNNYNNDDEVDATTSSGMMGSSGVGGPADEMIADDNKTNLIVNYLPQTMSQDEIRSLFATVGEIDTCKLIRDKTTGQSLGYGFVNYRHPEHARRAIDALNGLRLQTKTIKVSLARPSSETIKGANLYVSGLSKTMTQMDVDKLFHDFGRIVTSRLLCDSQTGLSKGVGFVRYETRQEAEQAIKHLNGTVPLGTTEPVTVKFANCPNSTSKLNSVLPGIPSSVVTPFLAAAQSRRYLPPPGVNTHPANTQFRYTPLDGSTLALPGSGLVSGSILNGCGWCIFVYNLAPETEENVLWQLFGPFGAVQNVRVMRDLATQKCKGFGFVTMTNYDEALTAVSALNGYQLGNRVLQVSFKKTKSGFGPAASSGMIQNL